MKQSLRLAVVGVVLAMGFALPAQAASSKEMIQLQTQIQALQDAIARLQQSNDERMGVLKDLVQQTADAVNKMTLTVGSLKQQMDNNKEAAATKSDALAGQIQGLNDSLDELKARMVKMERMLGDVQGQQQQTNAALANLPQGGGGAVSAPPASNVPSTTPTAGPAPGAALPMPDNTTATKPKGKLPPPQAGPSSGDLYRAAYSDYMAGKSQLAASEFSDLIKAYPDDNLSGNAYFYLGEMDFRGDKETAAVKNYDQVLERYPNNAKIPAAHLHKGEALLAMKQTDAGVRELRALVQRFPASPEAAQAKVKIAAAAKK
jgi:TolA-binding protein